LSFVSNAWVLTYSSYLVLEEGIRLRNDVSRRSCAVLSHVVISCSGVGEKTIAVVIRPGLGGCGSVPQRATWISVKKEVAMSRIRDGFQLLPVEGTAYSTDVSGLMHS